MMINGIETAVGQIGWKEDKGYYQQVFHNLTVQAESVTLTSDLGGTITKAVSVR